MLLFFVVNTYFRCQYFFSLANAVWPKVDVFGSKLFCHRTVIHIRVNGRDRGRRLKVDDLDEPEFVVVKKDVKIDVLVVR